jgi:hypothetical protein
LASARLVAFLAGSAGGNTPKKKCETENEQEGKMHGNETVASFRNHRFDTARQFNVNSGNG